MILRTHDALAALLALALGAGSVGGRASATPFIDASPRQAASAPATDAPPTADRHLEPGERVVIDDFEDVAPWSAHPADGVSLAIDSDAGLHGRALRLDFAFTGGGYAVVRREVDLDLPENYRFRFSIRGACSANDLELKLIDGSGENVWWCNRRMFQFPTAWDSLSTRKRQITFAWGPAGGGEIRRLAAIEIAVTAGSGGSGSVWLDDFTLEALPPADTTPPAPRASASSAARGHAAVQAVDGDSASFWSSGPGDRRPWIDLDLGGEREFGGLVIDWMAGRHARDYVVETSAGDGTWHAMRTVRDGHGGRVHLRVPESEAARLRIRVIGPSPRSVAVREITVQPLAWGATLNAFFEAIAKEAPRGSYPRGMSGEQTYWTVIGADGDREEALLSEDGMLETGKGKFSIEPFLLDGKRLVTWADARVTQHLEEGQVPRPSVRWRADSLELTVRPFALAVPGSTVIWTRYAVRNLGARQRRVTLFLALRPFQVNPPAQFLNTTGGAAPLERIERQGRYVFMANGEPALLSISAPSDFGVASFDQGDVVVDFLRDGHLPAGDRVTDPQACASGAVSYVLDVAPGGIGRDVIVVVPIEGGIPQPLQAFAGDGPGTGSSSATRGAAAESATAELFASSRRSWESEAEPVIDLPPRAAEVARTLSAQVRWILINRDGAGIQPGSRAYERSWIRDGALTSSALLRMGHPDVVREFAQWFATYQYADGKVPCCVDRRGADPVPEHDSHGEFIFLVAEYYRYTGDRVAVEALWPAVAKAAAYLDTLRALRRTAEWRTPEGRPYFGLLPPSISHEGYSAKPMHSYWDDFFALRGFKDAVFLARVLGHENARARLVAHRDEFAHDLAASIRAAMAVHRIDVVPGCADLGDFDATSTTIALAPAAAENLLPPGALERTFERYWTFFTDRRDGTTTWEAFTPYEIRTIGAFVRLGWRERANELLEFFMSYRRPQAWRQWSEVVWNDERQPHFIGDLPHTWVGSDFVRSVLDMFAYERESDQALVLGAGVPWAWVSSDDGISVRRLATPFGELSYRMKSRGDTLDVRIAEGLRVPRGGIVVMPPAARSFRRAIVDGQAQRLVAGAVVIRALPSTIVLEPGQ